MKFWLKFSRKFKLFSQTFELVSSNFEMQSVINLLDRLSLTRRTHKYLKNASNLLKMKNHVFIYQTNSCWIHVLHPVLRTLDFSEMLEIKHKHSSSKKKCFCSGKKVNISTYMSKLKKIILTFEIITWNFDIWMPFFPRGGNKLPYFDVLCQITFIIKHLICIFFTHRDVTSHKFAFCESGIFGTSILCRFYFFTNR